MRIWLICLLAVCCLVTSAQFVPFPRTGGGPSVIPYCSSVGYPSAPYAGNVTEGLLAVEFSADSFSPCSATTETSWTDSSGNANTATFTAGTATCNSGQLNGHNAVTLTGSIKASLANDLVAGGYQTAFVVFKQPSFSASTEYALFASTIINPFEYEISTSGSNVALQRSLQQDSAQRAIGTIPITANVWHQMFVDTQVAGGSLYQMNLDRVSDSTGTSYVIGGPNVLFYNAHDNNSFCTGCQIAEMFLYNAGTTSSLSSAHTLYNECYIYGKYGI